MSYFTLVSTELLKLRRTRIPWVLALIYAIAPLMVGLMMLVLKDPQLGSRLGLVTAKAQLTIGTADWPTYLMILGLLYAGGLIVLGIHQAFVFGREYAELTAKNLLTLPVGRLWVVAAKLTVTAMWFVVVAVFLWGEGIGLGFLIGLPGFRSDLLRESAVLAALLTFQVLLLSPAPAWIAVATRGYLAPVGLSILFLLVGDLFAHTGWGPWVPWSIPLLAAGAAGKPVPTSLGSMAVLVATFAAGSLAAWRTLDRSDNTQ